MRSVIATAKRENNSSASEFSPSTLARKLRSFNRMVTIAAIAFVLTPSVNASFTQPMDVSTSGSSPAGTANGGYDAMRMNIFKNPNIALTDSLDDPFVETLETSLATNEATLTEVSSTEDTTFETAFSSTTTDEESLQTLDEGGGNGSGRGRLHAPGQNKPRDPEPIVETEPGGEEEQAETDPVGPEPTPDPVEEPGPDDTAPPESNDSPVGPGDEGDDTAPENEETRPVPVEPEPTPDPVEDSGPVDTSPPENDDSPVEPGDEGEGDVEDVSDKPVDEAPSEEESEGSSPPISIVAHQMEALGGRVTTIRTDATNIVAVNILERPDHGHLSINPDNSLSLVLTRSDYTGPMSFAFETIHADGSITQHEMSAEISPGPQQAGWGTSESHYMLATGEDGKVQVEHGDNHRKVYVSGSEDALTAADIAAREGLSPSQITGAWLRNVGTAYGTTEDTALSPALADALYSALFPSWSSTGSHWILLERGYEYNLGTHLVRGNGESEIHPLVIGAWGEGDKPSIDGTNLRFGWWNSFSNIVIQDIDLSRANVVDAQPVEKRHENILLDGITAVNKQITFQEINGLTIINSIMTDNVEGQGHGLYVGRGNGILLENLLLDHNGWSPDYTLDGSEGGRAPNSMSHNVYLQHSTLDVTMRDSVVMRGSANGVQFRGGAFVEDNAFIANGAAGNFHGGNTTVSGGTGEAIGNYSLLLGNLVTQAGGKPQPLGGNAGAQDWGFTSNAYLNSLVENIVAHASDPDNESDTIAGRNAMQEGFDPYFNDTIIWRWRLANQAENTQNIHGLDLETLDHTTIHRYALTIPNKGIPNDPRPPYSADTIQALAEHLRGLEGGEYTQAVQDMLAWFRSGFGIDLLARAEATTLRFVPDERGDGVRWDNRLNWDSGDLPGTIDGDSVDLGGNTVVFGGTVRVDDLQFGDHGGLVLTNGRLTVENVLSAGGEKATLEISRAGQFWTNGYEGDGLLSINVDGGRFANTGTFLGPVELTATKGQTILASDGAVFAATSGSRVEIVGYEARVGFDGRDGGMAFFGLDVDATLAFISTTGGLGSINTFRSGAFGDAPNVQSGVDLGGAALEIDLSALAAKTDKLLLLDADELVGNFSSVSIHGLSARDAEIIIDYEADAIWLRLTEGSGRSSLSHLGSEDMVSDGNEHLWQALMQGAALGQAEAWDI